MFEFISANLSAFNSLGLLFVSCTVLSLALNQGKVIKLVDKLVDFCKPTSEDSSGKDTNGTCC